MRHCQPGREISATGLAYHVDAAQTQRSDERVHMLDDRLGRVVGIRPWIIGEALAQPVGGENAEALREPKDVAVPGARAGRTTDVVAMPEHHRLAGAQIEVACVEAVYIRNSGERRG